MKPTKEIITAINHVRSVFPQVDIVIFTKEERWLYLSSSGYVPKFDEKIDVSILEKAVDSINDFPAIYQI